MASFPLPLDAGHEAIPSEYISAKMVRYFRQIGSFRQNPLVRCRSTALWGCYWVLASWLLAQPSSPAKPEAKSLLEKAVRRLPQAEFWATGFRQQWLHTGLTARVQGTLAVGRSRQVRLEVQVVLADVQAELKLYSDGKTLWRYERLPGAEGKLTRYTFEDLEQAIAQANLSEGESARLREALLAEHGLQSLRWRLTELASRYQWGPPQPSQLPDGRPAWLLEGTYNEKTLQDAFRGQLPQAPEFARRCRVFLLRQDTWWGGDSLWPARIEWWGLPRNHKEEQLLTWLEYEPPRRLEAGSPQLQSPFTSEEMAQAATADLSQLITATLERLR